MILGDLLQRATAHLSATSPTARLDAEVLVAHVLGLARSRLISEHRRVLDAEAVQNIETLLRRRELGEPVAYLTGEREFWSLPLKVSPAVLIPRPETELLVEQALRRIPDAPGTSVADLGTGSGAIALAIASERPRAHVVATDVSPEALAMARANAESLGTGNVEFRPGDWLAPLDNESFDVIVSNPPYVCENDPHLRQGDVRFEPAASLAAGDDGLDAIRTIVRDARRCLKRGGWLLLEHGFDQAPAVGLLLSQNGYTAIRGYADLAGHPRIMEARLKQAGHP